MHRPRSSKVICTVVTLLLSIPGLNWGAQSDHVEVFCGKGEVTMAEIQAGVFKKNEKRLKNPKQFLCKVILFDLTMLNKFKGNPDRFRNLILQAGRSAIGIDLAIGGPSMDISTDLGFCNCLYHICNLRAGSAALMAPVCGSWVFM